VLAAGLGALALACAPLPRADRKPACDAAGTWLDPATGESLPADRLMAAMSRRTVVLLGESHDEAEQHRWQLHTLAGLHALRPRLVVGFEMFPRAAQPVLDAWSRGELSERQLLKRSRWDEVWGHDPALYLPLFHFVRQQRLPMAALNVKRALVSRVGREGWGAVPEAEKEGISRPAPATEPYRSSLAEVYRKAHRRGAEAEPALAEVLASEGFERFVEAQLTWDRAMAEALAAARAAHPDALVTGILGRGHAEHGWGVPRQLADLGVDDVAVLLPVAAGDACRELEPRLADAVFLMGPDPAGDAPIAPSLGARVAPASGGVRVTAVDGDSVAADAGLAAGDLIAAAAGVPLDHPAALRRIVGRQAPGTWLPLEVRRDGRRLSLVARFPTGPD
jgi:uncharacterized iron-regulated protein